MFGGEEFFHNLKIYSKLPGPFSKQDERQHFRIRMDSRDSCSLVIQNPATLIIYLLNSGSNYLISLFSFSPMHCSPTHCSPLHTIERCIARSTYWWISRIQNGAHRVNAPVSISRLFLVSSDLNFKLGTLDVPFDTNIFKRYFLSDSYPQKLSAWISNGYGPHLANVKQSSPSVNNDSSSVWLVKEIKLEVSRFAY